ncbi:MULTISPECIES: 50S ribosomal protein L32 [Halodesulfovibrio]|jgi:large subunit ribosomal protein L32|uniref:Large ribosomal subunit protein bL32 n=1 Tax=Halodesulfovibrio aestuarii TaxID=126333 RepID=A0A8G2C6R3_9BACT|nr:MULTISPECIES: 50S ribosomal protein L32 [Halodesulfovibrio]MCT4536153.1 50S ribosomal protein L32 [Halodesulfovibrio sp.]MCT4626797.1 50S ribosomal protein L32 [Halodesulfovibrio sp.]SHI49630.1 LSU ribosomal protein L32P [Halodesulfovibrio aestuarii]
MAVAQKRKSKSRKGMRRSHHRVAVPSVVYCECGEAALPHRVCAACGTYNGRQISKDDA